MNIENNLLKEFRSNLNNYDNCKEKKLNLNENLNKYLLESSIIIEQFIEIKYSLEIIKKQIIDNIWYKKNFEQINLKLNKIDKNMSDLKIKKKSCITNFITNSKELEIIKKNILFKIEKNILENETLYKKLVNNWLNHHKISNKPNKTNKFKIQKNQPLFKSKVNNNIQKQSLELIEEQDVSNYTQNTEALGNINNSVNQVVNLFNKMFQLASLQEESLMEIEMESEKSVNNIKKTKFIWKKILNDISKQRGTIIKIFSVVFIISVLFILLK